MIRASCAIALFVVAFLPAVAQAQSPSQAEVQLISPAEDALVLALGDFANGCRSTLARLVNRPIPEGEPQTCPPAPLNLGELRYIVEMGRMNGVLRGCGSESWRTHFGSLDLKLRARADFTESTRNYGAFLHGLAQGMTRTDDAPRICGATPSDESRRRVEEWAMQYFTDRVAPLAWTTTREDYIRAGVPPAMLH